MFERKLTKKSVQHTYEKLMRLAKNKYFLKNYLQSLRFLRIAAIWENSFNYFYTDSQAESLLKNISDEVLGRVNIDGLKNRYAIIDSIGNDNKGLTQQYIRAMMSMGVEFMYVKTTGNLSPQSDIYKELKAYDKATILTLEKNYDGIELARKIVDSLVDYSPSKLLLHLYPNDVVALMACNAIQGPLKYNINLTDHAYWMGSSFIDYTHEVRGYGKTVSIEKRGLRKEQILSLPYYPVESKYTKFQGFPSIPKEAVKIFTGGSLYKMLGKNDVFFHLMDDILDLSPNVVVLVACLDTSSILQRKKSKMRNGNRVFLIGNRRDIDEVFAHIDIYLGTYPIGGGLMNQYAALHKKPIIAYTNPNEVFNFVEGIVNHNMNGVKTYTSIGELLNYASRLINDLDYRVQEGEKNYHALITKDDFNDSFRALMTTHQSKWNWNLEKIDYESFAAHYLALNNRRYFPLGIYALVSNFKLKVFPYFPQLTIMILPFFFELVGKKIKARIK